MEKVPKKFCRLVLCFFGAAFAVFVYMIACIAKVVTLMWMLRIYVSYIIDLRS